MFLVLFLYYWVCSNSFTKLITSFKKKTLAYFGVPFQAAYFASAADEIFELFLQITFLASLFGLT